MGEDRGGQRKTILPGTAGWGYGHLWKRGVLFLKAIVNAQSIKSMGNVIK